MVPVAHGNDMGGSIRVPASACGLVGLKPTRARTTLGPDFGELWGPVTHEHVLTRSVRDSAAILDAISGPGIGDPYTAPAPARRFADEVGADPGRLRIGFRTAQRDGVGPSHPECIAAVAAAARSLEALGHEVAPTELPALDDPRGSAGLAVAFGTVVAREVERWSAALGRQLALDELEPINALLAEMGAGVTGAQWLATLEDLQLWTRAIATWWEDHDVLLLPVLPEPPFGFGEIGPTAPDAFDALMRTTTLMGFTVPFNVTGQPAISLPLHMTADGLPVGVQLVAASGREDVLLRLAAQLELAMPWADRHPELDRAELR
jgi:amidase